MRDTETTAAAAAAAGDAADTAPPRTPAEIDAGLVARVRQLTLAAFPELAASLGLTGAAPTGRRPAGLELPLGVSEAERAARAGLAAEAERAPEAERCLYCDAVMTVDRVQDLLVCGNPLCPPDPLGRPKLVERAPHHLRNAQQILVNVAAIAGERREGINEAIVGANLRIGDALDELAEIEAIASEIRGRMSDHMRAGFGNYGAGDPAWADRVPELLDRVLGR